MSFQYPVMVVVAVAVGAGLLLAYRALHRQRTTALAASGLSPATTRRANLRRHVPPLLFVLALIFLMLGVARPQATVPVPRAAGTVILAFDISNSMGAKDVAPTRLEAARAAAIEFVESQPDSVDFGVVSFGTGAIVTQLPSDDRPATIAAIKRLAIAGGTSMGQGIMVAMTAITGQAVTLPDPSSPTPPLDLGYWGSATIVILSDGVESASPRGYVDPVAAAALAAEAGVHIETIGIGTVGGAVIEVDGFQMATTLNEELLAEVAETASGSYHRAENAQALGDVYRSLDLRITVEDKLVEVTGAVVIVAVLLLTIGGILMVNWFGRIL